MMKSAIPSCALLLSGAAGLLAGEPAPPAALPPEVLVVSAQPSVFLLQAYGAVDVVFPKKVTLNRARLEKEFSLMAGVADKAAFCWSRILGNPDEYLKASAETERWHEDNGLFGAGSAFAVDRGGILLTNAHNLQDPPPDALLSDFQSTLSLLQKPIGDLLAQLEAELGAKPDAATFMRLHGNLVQWYGSRSHTSGKFKEARVVLKFGQDFVKLEALLANPNEQADFAKILALCQQEEISASASVLARGEVFPGRDVAVLRVMGGPENRWRAPSSASDQAYGLNGPYRPRVGVGFGMHTDFICLPLGDSDLVLPGAAIHALGFPGAAFVQEVMGVGARYLVSSRTGEIGQTKPTSTGYSVFEMAADINHGDSGGPVIDRAGRAIAINVASTGAPGHNLAIPINVAKDLLRQAGITPDPGPLSALWLDALRAYAARRYEEAEGKLRQILESQAAIPGIMGKIDQLFQPGNSSEKIPLGMPWRKSPRVNPDVLKMWERCRKAQGKSLQQEGLGLDAF
jgi:hypothetical protein